MSFKYGDFEGERDGRFFMDMTSERNSVRRGTFVDINKLIKRNPGCRLVDVRTPDEYRMGHIPGS